MFRAAQLRNRRNVSLSHNIRCLLHLEHLETRLCPATLPTTSYFSSLPGANHTIYLDFDGHVTQNTEWNNYFNNPTITSPAYDTDGSPTTFSASELADIEQAWKRISEDFIPFNVNVTTVEPSLDALQKSGSGDAKWGIRVIVTKDTQATGAGGIGYVDSFNWSVDTGVFVYVKGGKNVGEAASHEVGHSLGLKHDGTSSTAYYGGFGSGETSWAPIMGVGYYNNVTTWDKGEYYGSNNTGSGANSGKGADDLAIITTYNGFGYRADDVGNTIATSSPLTVSGTSVSGSGIITTTSDVDFYGFTTGAGVVTLNINPFTPGPNLDIRADLFDSAGNLVATSNSATTLSASFNLTLPAGQYYLKLDGTGFGSPSTNPPTGYSDYASLGRYFISGTVVSAGQLAQFSVNDLSVNEAAGTATFTVTLAGSITSNASVNYAYVNGTATAPSDYNGTSGTLTFTPGGSTTQSVTVSIMNDTLVESSETFNLNLSNVSGAMIVDSQGLATIVDNDVPSAQLSVNDLSVNEAAGTATFTVTLTGSIASTATVNYATTAGTATAPGDYTATSGTLTFTPGGSTTQTVTVAIVNDTTTESNETFTLNLSSASGATISDSQGLATIVDDDVSTTPTVSIAATSANKAEGTGTATTPFTFTVTRAGNTTGNSSVNWSVAGTGGVNASNASDFANGIFPSGIVSFGAGETTKTVTVNILADSIKEKDEKFRVTLSNASNAVLGNAFADGTVVNDDGGKPGRALVPHKFPLPGQENSPEYRHHEHDDIASQARPSLSQLKQALITQLASRYDAVVNNLSSSPTQSTTGIFNTTLNQVKARLQETIHQPVSSRTSTAAVKTFMSNASTSNSLEAALVDQLFSLTNKKSL